MLTRNALAPTHAPPIAFCRAWTHGYLMAPELYKFVNVALPEFFKSQLAQIPIKKLPKWLQTIVKNAENKDADALFQTLLSVSWNTAPQSPTLPSTAHAVWLAGRFARDFVKLVIIHSSTLPDTLPSQTIIALCTLLCVCLTHARTHAHAHQQRQSFIVKKSLSRKVGLVLSKRWRK